jgi:hypothetical protein
LCACFIDWQMAFVLVNWTKLMHIIKETGTAWRERRLSRKCVWIRALMCYWSMGDKKCEDWKSS